jgi:alkanesulfonate monooxygenase SsuD/methylene tetrahydromethanopterin reductase-like flavin-dependent oxidoreductase (luciferase family)
LTALTISAAAAVIFGLGVLTAAPALAFPERPISLIVPWAPGGSTDQTFSRAAASADGYVHGGGPPRAFARAAEKMRVAWHEAGRAGEPALWAQGYFALGDAAEEGLDYMRDYYAFTGPFAEKIAAGLLTTPQDVAQFVRGYEHAGCHELVLLPAVADLDQVEALAEVL